MKLPITIAVVLSSLLLTTESLAGQQSRDARPEWSGDGHSAQGDVAPDSPALVQPAAPYREVSGTRGRGNRGRDWDVASVLNQISGDLDSRTGAAIDVPWWTDHVLQPISDQSRPIMVNVGDLLLMAIENSAKISVARDLPRIRETAIDTALADFDWTNFVDARWSDQSDPVGSALTVGGGGTRFRDHNFTLDYLMRRKVFSGGEFEIGHRFGHQNSNSSFFQPNDQATSRITLGFTQPLMRGRGRVYNTSLILLAEIDAGSATDEFHRQLQSHLLEVARGYWALYLERAALAQKVNLYLKTRPIVDQLDSRAEIDAQRSQIVSARAALESRESDLIRAQAAVKNAETRLRALINSPALDSDAGFLEMIPVEPPTIVKYPADLASEFEIALQHRPEIAAAIKQVRAACVRLKMADHEILPSLNLVTETYVAGLRGQSDISNAWLDQFREGEPGYSVGLQWEVPLGRRSALANQRRRQVEVHQLREQYRATLELVRAEVEVSVRELHTAHSELLAKHRSLLAARSDVETQEARWHQLGDRQGTGGLLLESLLRAQERVTEEEFAFAKAQLTYNLALINLRHANGTLFQINGPGCRPEPQPEPMVSSSSDLRMAQQPPAVSPPAVAPPRSQPNPATAETQRYDLNRHWPPSRQERTGDSVRRRLNPQPHEQQQKLQRHPLVSGEASGLSYTEMIGGGPHAQARLHEKDWRNKLR